MPPNNNAETPALAEGPGGSKDDRSGLIEGDDKRTSLDWQARNAHDFARLELRAGIAYLRRRIAIALIKTEYGLLTAVEQDELLLAGAKLKAEVELWGRGEREWQL
jgi:hypothetical protein